MKLTRYTQEYKPEELTTPPEVQGLKPHEGSVHKDFLIIGDMPYDCYSPFHFYNSHLSYLNQFLNQTNKTASDFSISSVFSSFVEKGFYNKDLVSSARERLFNEIKQLKPKFILFLGRDTFKTIIQDPSRSFDEERGYPQVIKIHGDDYLCLFSLHPRDVFKQPKLKIVAQSDCAKSFRLFQEGWKKPSYSIKYWPSYHECLDALDKISQLDCLLSVDLETRGEFITCVGIAWSDSEAFVIPFHRENLKPFFSPLEEAVIWKKLSFILEEKNLLGQNACHYDSSILAGYGINANFTEDSMFLSWSVWQELPKTLGFLASIYTDYPYHKDMLSDARKGKIDFKQEFYYCGLDCCVTLKIYNELLAQAKSRSEKIVEHYRFNINFSRVLEYCSRHGICFNTELRDSRLKEMEEQAASMQDEINSSLGKELNVSSPKQVNQLLYEDWKLPPKIKVEEDEETGEDVERIKSGYLEILYLHRKFPGYSLLKTIGGLRKLKHRMSALKQIQAKDGFVYWDFNTTGTETGRASGKKPKNGFGCQPQNVDKRDRDLFFAPEGYDFYKADLEGADSWTQAAQLSSIGDDRLLNDLLLGLKPAQALALSIIYGTDILLLPTQEILALLKKGDLKTKEGKIKYGISKAISHGSAYMMKGNTMHSNIFKASDGELYVEPSDCEEWQKMFFLRYNFPKLHNHMRGVLNTQGYSEGSSGLRRYFLGRRDDSTLRTFLSSSPQANTGRATNETMLNLFTDPRNLLEDGSLILKPINQVHDEMDAIGKIQDREKIHELFVSCSSIEQEVFGKKFTIPFAEDRGSHWGNCEEVKWS